MKNVLKWITTTIICAIYPILLISKNSAIVKVGIVSFLLAILVFLWKEKLKQIRDEKKFFRFCHLINER